MTEIVQRRRRTAKLNERLQGCECCNYPISQRHHMLDVALFGENDYTRQLCANCHELYHIIFKCFTMHESGFNDPNNRAAALLDKVGRAWGESDSRIMYLIDLVNLVIKARVEIGKDQDKMAMSIMDVFLGGELWTA